MVGVILFLIIWALCGTKVQPRPRLHWRFR